MKTKQIIFTFFLLIIFSLTSNAQIFDKKKSADQNVSMKRASNYDAEQQKKAQEHFKKHKKTRLEQERKYKIKNPNYKLQKAHNSKRVETTPQ